MIKNFYRYPLMIGLPNYFEEHFPARYRDDKAFIKFCSSISIAAIESIILCPFERLKTYFMTARALKGEAGFHGDQPLTLRNFLQSSDSGLMRSLFRGIGSLFLRQCIAWVCFLQADFRMKRAIRRMYDIPEEESIPTRYLIVVSFTGAIFSTIVIMPFDSLKTN
mmetsp:Transcript_1132/g.2076  ORF Transcript_1132/g.2076 Transcript_1132/m.2076 type:complete len:165 (+) Transcript_1132:132-626(+)